MEETIKQLIMKTSFTAVYNCLNDIADEMRSDLEKVSLPLAPRKIKTNPEVKPLPEIIQLMKSSGK